MRVKYETIRDGDYLIAAAIVRLNKRERKRLEQFIRQEGEIQLCFLTTLTHVENPLIIQQFCEVHPDEEEGWERSDLLSMVEDEVADLRDLLEGGVCDA